jgi:hypothetical protein
MIKTKNTTRCKNGIVIELSLLDYERMGKNLIRMSNYFFFVNVVSNLKSIFIFFYEFLKSIWVGVKPMS